MATGTRDISGGRMNMTGVILAGGKNRRMGTNKAFLKIGSKSLLERNIGLLADIFDEVIIVVADPMEYMQQKATIVTDIFPGKGALGGLYTGLFYSSHKYAFVTACDMPFLDSGFIEYMAKKADGCDIVVPAPPPDLQPLCAVYSRRCLPAIRNLLVRNSLQIKGFYSGYRVVKIPEEKIRQFDPDDKMFTNLNTPEDLKILAGTIHFD